MRGLDRRTTIMAVDASAAVTRNVLENGQDAAFQQTVAHRSGEPHDTIRIAAVRAVADYRIGAGNRQIEHRHTIDGDAEPHQIIGDQPGADPSRLTGEWVGECSDLGGRRVTAPMGRAQPRHSSAFLIDQNGRISPVDAVAKRLDEATDLIGRAAIAPEQNKARRIGLGEKTPLVTVQFFAGATEDNGSRSGSRQSTIAIGVSSATMRTSVSSCPRSRPPPIIGGGRVEHGLPGRSRQ